MPVFRYRSVEEMPLPWRRADDAGSLRAVSEMLYLYRRFSGGGTAQPGVRRLRSVEELDEERNDPHRRGPRRRATR
jgi:hypothetical protein